MEKRIIEKLRPYQSFGSAAEMHRAVEVHIRNNRLNESALRVLRVLEFRSKIVPGASWLKYETIAGVIGKSVSTVRRAIRSLVDAGIIEKVAQTRDRMGGDGANIYVIKPIDHASEHAQMNTRHDDEKPHYTADEPRPREAKDDSSKDASNKGSAYVPDVDRLDASFTPDSVPKAFKTVAARFWNDAERIDELWQKAIMAYRSLGLAVVYEEVAIDSLKQAIYALKRRRIRGSFDGYYYGILIQKIVAYHRARVAEERGLYNWVEDVIHASVSV